MVIDSQITITTEELSELMDLLFKKLRESNKCFRR